jgi:hypothetical protein
MDLDGAHPGDSTIATSVSNRCWTACISRCHLLSYLSFTFLLVIFSCGELVEYLVDPVLIVIIFFRLINHDNRIKISACIHHMSLATFANAGATRGIARTDEGGGQNPREWEKWMKGQDKEQRRGREITVESYAWYILQNYGGGT